MKIDVAKDLFFNLQQQGRQQQAEIERLKKLRKRAVAERDKFHTLLQEAQNKIKCLEWEKEQWEKRKRRVNN